MQRLTMFMQKARVLVMVSHQLQEIQKNCNKVVWMEDGMIRSLGETDDVLQQYKEAMHSDRESR